MIRNCEFSPASFLPKYSIAVILAVFCISLFSVNTWADPFPPDWKNGETGTAAEGYATHYPPVAWPDEPSNPADCGHACGEWKPYTRFQNTANDPRTQDPSNGGTAPQNYVNISSSCNDKTLPSIYYYLYKGEDPDGADDVIFFRWRVEQIANTYGTGPNAGTYSATDPWNSALWTVLFDVSGSGYRDLAAHLNGSSGSPSTPIDLLAGIYGRIPTQSIDYGNSNIFLLGHNPTAFIADSDFPNPGRILNFQSSLTPTSSWPNGSAETVWDYGTSRAIRITTRSCTEYFIDYQIPLALLDATRVGGPRITRSTPIAMLFCTANSLNNPFQKDCAINRRWIADPTLPAPFGDYISFDQDKPYAQPIISSVTAQAPATCDEVYTLKATVQDTLYVNSQGTILPSIKQVSFWYYFDANGDGETNDSRDWVFAAMASLIPGTMNQWGATWDSRTLPQGRYLIGVQAVDDNTRLDNDMTPSGIDNRTFSYVTSNSLGEVYINGEVTPWKINPAFFPSHSPVMTPAPTENWYGNPAITGVQVAFAGVDIALNPCGVMPVISKTVDKTNVIPDETVRFTISISNTTGTPVQLNSIQDILPEGFLFQTTVGISDGNQDITAASYPQPGVSGMITWEFSGVTIADNQTVWLVFDAKAGSVAGNFNNIVRASTGLGNIQSQPVSITVDSARLTLVKTPDTYRIDPDGTTELTYTISYSNDSNVLLNDAVITDVLPAHVGFVGCTGGNSCGESGGTVTWQLGNLAGGDSGTVTLTVVVGTGYSSSSLVNTAQISATLPDGETITRETSVTIAVNVPTPAFTLTKLAAPIRIDPGGTVTWTIAYHNFGTGDAKNVLIGDTLPAGFTYTSCGVSGSHFTNCTHDSGSVVFHGSGGVTSGVTVPAGESGVVTVVGTASATTPFAFPNPAVNQCLIVWDGGSQTASASVGITGVTCDPVYYFYSGGLASSALPTSTTPTVVTVTKNTDVTTVFQTAPFSSALNIAAGSQMNVSFFVRTSSSSSKLQAELWHVGTSSTKVATTNQITLTNDPNVLLYNLTATLATAVSVNTGERLEWRIIVNAGGQDVNLYFGSETYNSRSSFCVNPPASLEIYKVVDKPYLETLPADIQYTILFANVGGTAASNVVIADLLPTGVVFLGATLNGNPVTPTGTNPYSFSIGTLASGAAGTLVINARVPQSAAGVLTNTAAIVGDGLDPVTATAVTYAGGLVAGGDPSIRIFKSADKTYIGSNEVVQYTITVVNVGEGPATGVVVTDTIPAEAYYAYVDGSIAGGNSRQVVGDTLTWWIDSLTVGQSEALTFSMASSLSGIPAGITELPNKAEVQANQDCTGSPLPSYCTSNTVTVTLTGVPSLVLIKTASEPEPPATAFAPGDLVTWTLTIRNTGDASAVGVLVTDPIISGTQFVSAEAPGTLDAVNNRVQFLIPTLSPGADQELRFVTRISSLDAGSQVLVNRATALAGNASAVQAQASIEKSATVEMAVEKSGPTGLPLPAATLKTEASASTFLTLESGALLSIGDYIRIGTEIRRILDKTGDIILVDSPVSAPMGTPIGLGAVFSISYRNDGNAEAINVQVSDTLPTGWVFAAAQNNPDDSSPSTPGVGGTGSVTWVVGSVMPGQSGTLWLAAIPTVSGSFTNVATLTADGGISEEAQFPINAGGLVVLKETSTPVVSLTEGTPIATYTISVTNQLSEEVEDVTVTDLLPAGFHYRTGSGMVGVTPTEPTFAVEDTGKTQPIWSGLTIPAQETLTIVFQADISMDTASGTYDNGVEIVVPAGVAAVPFDPLATTAEDVTVLGADMYLLQGYVFQDMTNTGAFDPVTDPGIASVLIRIHDGSALPPYEVYTDGYGFFQILLPVGSWEVSIPSGQGVLSALKLFNDYTEPVSVNLNPDTPVQTVYFGYVAGDTPEYSVTYNGNGSTGGTAPTDGSSPYVAGSTVTVLGQGGLTRNGFVFAGWNTASDGSGTSYSAGDSFSMPSGNVVLYAQWTPVYTVTYNGNGNTGGTAPVDSNSPYQAGNTVTVLGQGGLTRNGFVFVGWNTASDGSGTSYSGGDSFSMPSQNVVLYAVWNPTSVVGNLSLTKPDPQGSPVLGQILTYTITATNTGNIPLTNVVVTDPMLSPSQVSCGTLPPGQSCILSGSYRVTASDVSAGAINNTATADSDQTDPARASNRIAVKQDQSVSIPTVTEWGMLLLLLLMSGAGAYRLRRPAGR